MYLIVGLGNPGRDYEHTRHNAGFKVIDYLAWKYNINVNKIKFKGLCGDGMIGNNKVLLLKPQTYMNLSGESVLDAVQFYKIDIENLIVINDDVSIHLGRMRIRPSGSDGGHNGMKSIIHLLGDNKFTRLRVGIGAPAGNMVNHVIGRFNVEEQLIIADVLKEAAAAVVSMMEDGVQSAMNKYNSYKHISLIPPETEDKEVKVNKVQDNV
jgi:peptidyl-tRNA hydrolase, PTH1 family